MEELKPLLDVAALLSWTVRTVHCAHCKTSESTCGTLNLIALFFQHGDHFQSVVLELLVVAQDSQTGIPMMLPFVPAHIRILNMN